MGTMTGRAERRKRAFLSAILILAILVANFVPSGLTLTKVYAEDGDYFIPEHSKTSEDNGDGTYTLELSVTGDADTSQQTVGNVNVIIVYDRSSSMTSNRVNGNNSPRRADAAEKVVYDFVHKLFSYKQGANGTNIEVALVTFAVAAEKAVDWTTEESDIVGTDSNPTFSRTGNNNTARQDYSTNANGTNWEHALYQALDLLEDADGDPTFVVFITDGACSASGTDGDGDNPGYPPQMNFQQFYARYDAATGNARSIQTYDTVAGAPNAGTASNTNLYGIYAYGTEADLLDDLIYFSLTGTEREGMNGNTNTNDVGGYYFNAQQNEQVIAAIEAIFKQIVEALGVSSVSVKDGTTKEVSAGTGVTAELLEVDETSYKYWLSIELDANNQFKRVNMGTGEEETYTVTENSDGTCTVTWESGPADGVTVNGSVSMGTFKYEWTESNELYDKNPPEAKLNGSSVDWDLSSVGTLLDGVTYSVTFTVYPSQTTLDYIADIMNGTETGGEQGTLPGDIGKYIDENGNLTTNTTATLSYIDTREDDPQPHEETFENPPAVSSSAVEMLAVTKKWENELDSASKPPVTLIVTRDGEPTYTVELASTNTPNPWEDEVYISVGIMGSDGKPLEGAEGHDFTFLEPEDGSGVTYHWELNVPVVHPMIINGERTMLVKVDEKHPLPDGATTYTFKDYQGVESTYYVDDEMVSLTATNERRSSLLLTKEVIGDDAPEDALFPFTLNIVNSLAPETEPSAEEDPNHDTDWWVWVSIWDETSTPVNEGAIVSGATFSGYDGWYYGVSGEDIVMNIGAGYSIRINNLPTGTEYTVTEGDLPYGFIFKEAGMTLAEGSGSFDSFEGGRTSTGEIEETNTVYKITYKNEYALVDINVDKVWDDGSDQDGLRPDTLTLTFHGEDGVTYDDPEITVSKDGNTWTYTWEGVAKYDDEGNEIEYYVSEDNVPDGYTCEVTTAEDGGTITNVHVPATIDVSVTKAWDDANNQDGKRPDSVRFILYAGIERVGYIDLDGTPDEDGESAAWVATWTDLPKYADGEEILYTITEAISNLPEGYTAIYGEDGESRAKPGGTITNKYVPEETSVHVEKKWDDNNNQDGKRPDSVTFTLYADGKEVSSIVLDGTAEMQEGDEKGEEKPWMAAWYGLPKYAAGEEIEYTVVEGDPGNGYEVSYPNGADHAVDGQIITNSYEPEKTSIHVEKKWDDDDNRDGKRPGSVTFTLLANGEAVYGGAVELDGTAEMQEGDLKGEEKPWMAAWYELPKYADGEEIEYTVVEGDPGNGYEAVYPNDADHAVDGQIITNKYEPETVSVTVTKEWDDDDNRDNVRPAGVTFTLYANGEEVSSITLDGTADENGESAAWVATWEDLYKYENGDEIEYTVTEAEIEGSAYEVIYEDDKEYALDGETITNKHVPETTSVSITKEWDDDDDRDGIRPESVTFTLLNADTGETVGSITLDGTPDDEGESKAWVATWTDLYKYINGVDIIYTATEAEPGEGYEVIYPEERDYAFAGETITNKHEPETITVTITKVWDDSDDIGGIRPDSITVQLTANGKNSGDPQTLDNEHGWTYTWEDLYKYEDGKEIEYDADETAIPAGYTKTGKESVVTDEGLQITVTNKYTPKSVIVDPPVQKIIEGKEDLYNNGAFTFTIECTSAPDGVTAPMPTHTSVTNSPEYERTDKKGYYEFGEIEFTVPGTYVYTVTESGSVAGVTNDPEAETGKTITFVVTDDGTGVLVVTPTTDEVELSFTNTYSVEPIEFVLSASKTLEVESGNNAPDIDGKYTLSLKDEDGNVLDSKTNPDGNGTAVDFEALTFTEPGEYKYTVTEEGEVAGVTNGTASYDVVITVTDNGDGTMTAEVTEGSQTTEFVNTYSVEPTTAKIEAEKTLTGRDLEEGEFSFELKDSDGNVVETVTNAADGSVVFSELTFDAPDDYTYTINEVAGDEYGMTYDEKTVTVTVLVIDNGDGTMSAEVTYDPAGATFENTYEYHVKTEFTPEVTKELEGRDLEEGEFSFTLEDGDGKLIEAVTNAADGSVVFSEITYTEEDAGKTFTYVIKEAEGTDEDITYDTHTVTITVTVVDEGEGVLSVEASYEGSQTFHNVYTNPNTGDTSNLMLWVILTAVALLGFAVIMLLSRKKRY